MAIKGLIFDFDGLILDTENPLYQAWREIYAEYSQDLPLEVYAACIGASFKAFDPANLLSELTGTNLVNDNLHKKAKARGLELLHLEHLCEGFPGFLNDGRKLGLKLAVASSSNRSWVTGNLDERGLMDYFEVITTSEDVEKVKPAPDLYLAALDRLSLMPFEVIAFEDSINGVMSALNAGIKVIAVPNSLTRFMDLSQATIIIESLGSHTVMELIQRVETT